MKRDRISPSAAPISTQQDGRSLDKTNGSTGKPPQRETVTGTPAMKENGTALSGRSQPSVYEPG